MGEALTIPESTTRLRQKRAHRLLNRHLAARLVLASSIVTGLAFAFAYQSQTEADRLDLTLSARRDAVAAYVADVKVGMTAAQLAGDKQTLDRLKSQPTPARFFL